MGTMTKGNIHMTTQTNLFHTEMRGQLSSLEAIKSYILAGNATITIRSRSTGNRFTYRIRAPRENRGRPIWFVQLMNGPDNEESFQYFGEILANGQFRHGRRARIGREAISAMAFNWFWNMVQAGRTDVIENADVWHEGRCGRCGRKLTVPESIETGLGPECRNRV